MDALIGDVEAVLTLDEPLDNFPTVTCCLMIRLQPRLVRERFYSSHPCFDLHAQPEPVDDGHQAI